MTEIVLFNQQPAIRVPSKANAAQMKKVSTRCFETDSAPLIIRTSKHDGGGNNTLFQNFPFPIHILQEKIDFAPVIETPQGPTKAEVRIMYLWLDGTPAPEAVTTVIRMGRGKMMGVDHNRDMEWVGASAGFTPP